MGFGLSGSQIALMLIKVNGGGGGIPPYYLAISFPA